MNNTHNTTLSDVRTEAITIIKLLKEEKYLLMIGKTKLMRIMSFTMNPLKNGKKMMIIQLKMILQRKKMLKILEKKFKI